MGQGLYVRQRAQHLPEPAGPRKGTAGSGPVIRLLIAGDSSAAGVGVEHQSQALCGQLVSRLSQSRCVHWQLEATTGHTTGETINRLSLLPDSTQFDVAVLALGVNDVTRARTARQFYSDQRRLLSLLKTRFHVKRFICSGVPPMEQFPALPQPLAWFLGKQASRLDQVLAALSYQIKGMHHLPFTLQMSAHFVAEDGYHPNAVAYARWADAIADILSTGFLAEAVHTDVLET